MAYIPKGNSAWLLRKAINRSDSAIADLETNLTTLARTASNTGTSTTTQVLFNDAGIVNGDAGLVYNKTTDALSVGGALNVSGATTLTGAATVQGLTLGRGNNAIGSNTAFGNSALAAVTIATAATAIGNGALDVLTNGDYNTAIGNSALGSCTIGVNNTAIGHAALGGVVSGIENTCMGTLSAYQATGDANTGFGARTLVSLTAGANNYNTAIGHIAGYQQITGSNNGFFGATSYGDSNTASNSYNYGDGSVTSHKFRNGNLVVANGRIDVGGASAALRITSSPGDMYQTVASKQALGSVTSITVVFTTSNASVNTVIVDAQLAGFQAFADFCLCKYSSQATQVLRTNATAGITSTLVLAGSIFTFTITIASPTTIDLPILNLKVSVGGGVSVAPTFTVLPVVTFI